MFSEAVSRINVYNGMKSASAMDPQHAALRRPGRKRQNGERALHMERDALPHGLAGSGAAGRAGVPHPGHCAGRGVCSRQVRLAGCYSALKLTLAC